MHKGTKPAASSSSRCQRREVSLTDEETPHTWVTSYYPAFDGIRAVAILMVSAAHYGPIVSAKFPVTLLWSGVDVFFVLSGFLITGILFDTRRSPRFFRTFYVRRALRIFPLYFGFFLAVAVLTPVLHLGYSPWLWSNVLYVSNLFIRGALLHHHGNPTVLMLPGLPGGLLGLGHLWSLCVEEQFYLIWPLIVYLFPVRRRLMTVAAVLIGATIVLRTALFLHATPAENATEWLYYSTFSRSDTLLIGAWLALWLRGVALTRTQLRRMSRHLVAIAAATLAAVLTVTRGWSFYQMNAGVVTVGYTLLGLMAAGVLLRSLDEHSRVCRILRWAPFRWLGRLSYGFYFFQGVIEPVALGSTDRWLRRPHLSWLVVPGALGVVMALSWMSFALLESPFLRIKKRFAPDHLSVPSGKEI